MAHDFRRRLEALERSAGASICLGCLREDVAQAESEIHGGERLQRKLATHLGLELPEPPTKELERERAEAQATVDRARANLTHALKTVPGRKRKLSCPSCKPRTMRREQVESISRRVSAHIAALGLVPENPRN